MKNSSPEGRRKSADIRNPSRTQGVCTATPLPATQYRGRVPARPSFRQCGREWVRFEAFLFRAVQWGS